MRVVTRGPEQPPTLTGVLRHRAFAVLFGAETQSVVGDQLARVALSVLVFRQTGSAAATALTYAATYLPAILGGAVLAGVGDRLPGRAVMVGCDLLRAGLFAAMASPQLPLWAVVVLLVVAVFLGPAFAASEVSYLAGELEQEHFRVGTGLRMVANQAAQVFGFALGGGLVEVLGPRAALLVDAGTYVVSALLIATLLTGRPAAVSARPTALSVPTEAPGASSAVPAEEADEAAFAGLWRDRPARSLLALVALAGFFVVPEGLAVPFGHAAGAGPARIGFLLAAIPLGGAVGAAALVRLVPSRRRPTVARWMAVGCGLPLLASGVIGSWPVAVGCWFVSGTLAAYQVETTAALVQLMPAARRARLIGVAGSVLLGAQGAGLVVFAGVARLTSAGVALGIAGLAGSAIALVLVGTSTHSASMRGRPA